MNQTAIRWFAWWTIAIAGSTVVGFVLVIAEAAGVVWAGRALSVMMAVLSVLPPSASIAFAVWVLASRTRQVQLERDPMVAAQKAETQSIASRPARSAARSGPPSITLTARATRSIGSAGCANGPRRTCRKAVASAASDRDERGSQAERLGGTLRRPTCRNGCVTTEDGVKVRKWVGSLQVSPGLRRYRLLDRDRNVVAEGADMAQVLKQACQLKGVPAPGEWR